LLHEPLAYENEDGDYYKLVTQMALDGAVEAPRYGAVFVDEGQDFSDDMLAVLRKCLVPDGTFWVALDTAQNLYDIPRTWLDDKKLRRFALRNPYRATRKLTAFCESLVAHGTPDTHGDDDSPQVFSVHSMEGDAPQLHRIADAAEGAACIVDRIRHLHGQGVPYSEMMVLYASRHYEGLDDELPVFLRDVLEEHGILTSWPAQNAQSKAGWDITTDSVTISTIHSMKGMDAEAVFVIGLDTLKANHAPAPNSLAYVACTRARRFLDILYVKDTPLIASMRKALDG